MLSDEFFRPRWSQYVFIRRYPCSEAAFSAQLWNARLNRYPSKRQLVADDIVRCDLLAGMTVDEVVELLGPPSEGWRQDGRKHRSWVIGDDRSSFIRIDPELLAIEFRANDTFKSASMYQG